MLRAASFSLRDVLQALLPTLLAVILFYPMFGDVTEPEILFLGAALSSYAVGPALDKLSKWLYALLPILKGMTQTLKRERFWWSSNWDYQKLFYSLTADERNYVYLTAAYSQMYRMYSALLLFYASIQAYSLIAVGKGCTDPLCRLQKALAASTPVLGGLEVPTFSSFFVAAGLFAITLVEYKTEYEVLFHAGGQYPEFAAKYQEREGGLARAVWGEVERGESGEPVPNVTVILTDCEGNRRTSVSDSKGRFQFCGAIEWLNGKEGRLTVDERSCEGSTWEVERLVADRIPQFLIRIMGSGARS